MRDYQVSLIIFVVYLISSFYPIVQILMAYMNGFLIAIFGELLGVNVVALGLALNLIILICYLLVYVKSRITFTQILNGILASVFISCLVLFIFEEYFINTDIYEHQFIINACIIGVLLFLMDWIRFRSK